MGLVTRLTLIRKDKKGRYSECVNNREFYKAAKRAKLFLDRREQAASLQITLKAADSVRVVGNRQENRHRFQVLVLNIKLELEPHLNGF